MGWPFGRFKASDETIIVVRFHGPPAICGRAYSRKPKGNLELDEIPDRLHHFTVGSFHAATVPSDRAVAESVHQERVGESHRGVDHNFSGWRGVMGKDAKLAKTTKRRG